MRESTPQDPFFERALIGRTPEEKEEAYERRAKELTRVAETLAGNDQEQGE